MSKRVSKRTNYLSTNDFADLVGTSLRQLQWWDERGFLSVELDGHCRMYQPAMVRKGRLLARSHLSQAKVSPLIPASLLRYAAISQRHVLVSRSKAGLADEMIRHSPEQFQALDLDDNTGQIARHEAHMRSRRPRGNGRGRASMSGSERLAANLKGWETRRRKVREESE